ncbi:hypothetical protein SESBI_04153 [Sesbania bispinosa]|nr:hypothetical protein SESBI_04153 [Sesbania bispinosa]
MATFNPTVPKYGPKLRVPPAKTIIALMDEHKLWSSKHSQGMEDESTNPWKKMEVEELGMVDEEGGPNPDETRSAEKSVFKVLGMGPSNLPKEMHKNISLQQQKERICNSAPNTLLHGPCSEKSLDPTFTDLKEGKRRAGLGPKNIKDLMLQEEFIGLPEPVIPLDTPSRVINKYMGASQSQADIQRYKATCTSMHDQPGITLPHNLDMITMTGHLPYITKKTNKVKGGVDYFIEFPKDDYEEKQEDSVKDILIPAGIENQLIQGISTSLSLKRQREEETEAGEGGGPKLAPPPPMSRIAWNDRGPGASSTIRELMDLWDFNEVLSQAEKEGIQPYHVTGANLFRFFLEDTGLIDLDLKGSKFTWASNPRGGFVTSEKLDCVLVNWASRADFPHAMAISLPSKSSDRSPIVL